MLCWAGRSCSGQCWWALQKVTDGVPDRGVRQSQYCVVLCGTEKYFVVRCGTKSFFVVLCSTL